MTDQPPPNHEREILRALALGSPDGLLVVDDQGEMLLTNEQLVQMWHAPPELLESRDAPGFFSYVSQRLRDPTAFIACVERLRGSDHERARDSILLEDGRTFQYDSLPLRDDDQAHGRYHGRAWSFRDVTADIQIQESLRAARDQLGTTLRALPDLFFEVDREGKYHDFQAPQRELLYRKPEEFLGRHVRDVMPEPAASLFMQSLERAAIHGRDSGTTYSLDLADQTHWFEVWIAKKEGTPANDERFVTLVRDVTERERLARSLQHSEEQYRQLIECAGMSVMKLALDGTILFINALGAEYHDATASELVGLPIARLFPRMADELLQQIQQVAQSVKPSTFEHVLESSTGPRWLSSDLHPVADEHGTVISVLLHSHEITHQKQAEARMRVLASMVEQSNDAFVGTDLHGKINQWNQAAEKLLGYTEQEILGEPLVRLIPPQHLAKDEAAQAQAAAPENRGAEYETLRIHKDGRSLPVSIRLSPMFDMTGELIGHYGIVRDIAERKRMEEARTRAMRMKDEFLASMSHELRTPLNSILGVAEAISEGIYGPLHERQREPLQTIHNSGRHLLELIDDVLDLSRIEADQIELQRQDIRVDELCSAVVRVVRPQVAAADLRLRISSDGDVDVLRADPRRLKQILLNLLSNAIKFTAAGGKVSLDVERHPTEEAVVFSVSDTGVGIPPEQMHLLFEPFVQLDSSLTRKRGGSGLGLALSKRLTELHDGRIEVTSEVGQGSCFTVVIPDRLAEAVASSVEAPPPPGASPPVRNAVLVEDSHPAAQLATLYLEGLGMDVTVVNPGQDVVEVVRRIQPALVVLDLLLPGLSGWDILERLKDDEGTRQVPVLVVSVVDEPALSLSKGAAMHLTKPISRQQFIRAVHECATVARSVVVATDATVVLIVDDNLNNVGYVRDFLHNRGYGVEVALTSAEGLDKARRQRPAVVLMDIQMPDMDGLEATRRLRQDERTREIPIIAVTALAMVGDRERCLAAGADDYLAKPYSLRDLEARIARLTGASPMLDALPPVPAKPSP